NKADREIVGIGIGSAGPIYPTTGTVSPVNIPVWRDFPLVKCFRDVFDIERVALHGDAMALAHAEHKVGAGVGSRNMLGIVVSTGIGGGVAQAGDIYWNPLMKHIRAESEYHGFLRDLKVSPAKLTTDAGLIGAALGVL
uniref:ROK family protein n=1 Tax=Candidatus Planktophila sp. TaxID=2175601 RepID=UPI004048FA0F